MSDIVWRRDVIWEPSPDPCGDMTIRFVFGDERGLCQFVMHCGWYTGKVRLDLLAREMSWSRDWPNDVLAIGPKATDLGYHSPKPRYEDQTSMGECPLLGRECWYDGSTLNAEPVLKAFLRGGVDEVWRNLEEYHRQIFQQETSP